MSDHSKELESFPELDGLVESIGNPLSPEDLDGYLKIKNFQLTTYQLRTFVDVWKNQQIQDRDTRKYYARWLLIIVCAQIAVINILFILIGTGVLKVEQWTSNTFIISVFAEISGMVLIVVNYLFPKSKSTDGSLIDILKRGGNK